MPSAQAEAELVHECLGLPFVGERTLTAEEREELGRSASRASRRALVGLLFGTLVLLGLLVIDYDRYPTGVVALLMTLAIILAALPLAWSRDGLRFRYLVRRDLKRGVVFVYRGRLGDSRSLPDAATEGLRAGLLRRDPAEEQSVEVLPGSGMLVAANGYRPSEPVAVIAIAAPPARPRADLLPRYWDQWFETDEGVAVNLAERELTLSEREEATAELRRDGRHFRERLLVAVLANLWLLLWLGILIAGDLQGWREVSLLVVAAAFAAWIDRDLLIELAKRREVFGDLRLGRVRVIRLRNGPYENGESSEQLIEALPRSGVILTIDGQMAPWRWQPTTGGKA